MCGLKTDMEENRRGTVGQTVYRLSGVLHLWPYCLECSTILP